MNQKTAKTLRKLMKESIPNFSTNQWRAQKKAYNKLPRNTRGQFKKLLNEVYGSSKE